MSQITTPSSTTDDALNVPVENRPRHIAVIMDGNGRWALKRNQPRIAGHRAGAKAVRDIIIECARLKLEALTLYSFSMENWKRPAEEVGALMNLYLEYLVKERQELIDHNVRFVQLGQREGLPDSVLREMDETTAATSNCTGLTLCVALNYSSRAEITNAVRRIAKDVKSGQLEINDIDEDKISSNLYTAGIPDPDLLVRTAGEMRISNYLLWQISYAEIYVTDVYWPDFRVESLHEAIQEYARRNRRFGGLDNKENKI